MRVHLSSTHRTLCVTLTARLASSHALSCHRVSVQLMTITGWRPFIRACLSQKLQRSLREVRGVCVCVCVHAQVCGFAEFMKNSVR